MYSKLSYSWLKHWDFILLDAICLQISFVLAYVVRHGVLSEYNITLYRNEAALLFVSQILALFFDSNFSGVLKRGYYIEFNHTVKHIILVMVCALVFLFVNKETGTYSRIVFIVTAIIYIGISFIGRLLLKNFIKKKANIRKQQSLVVVTTKEIAEETLTNLKQESNQQYTIKAVYLMGTTEDISKIQGYPVIENEEHMIEYVCREWVDEVLFVLPAGMEVPEHVLDTLTLMGIAVHVPVSAKNMKGGKQFVENVGGYTVLTTSISIVDKKHMIYKRVLDIIGGIVGCLMTALLVIIIGPMIYIKSPGPIFFSQIRIGKNGRKFKIYKFRSMYLNAEERKKELMEQNKMSGHMFKLDYDPRIIGSEKIGKDGKPKGIGNFIRSTSIDEFPQFWNVLKGDMSLVGTRPPTVDEWEQYEPHHRARMAIKPGITGMWQVSGRSDITEFEEVVQHDTQYIENWNLGLDIKILLMTVLKVLKNDGAV